MRVCKIFLASSAELKQDRVQFELQINRRNKAWAPQGVFLELVVWEDFLDALSPTRLQDEYNRAISQCDVFVMLFWSKVGPYTEEEFDRAVGQFQATRRPFIYTYFNDAPVSIGSDEEGLMSLLRFKKKLAALGHFYTPYRNVEGLQLHFLQQLDKLVANGFIEFPKADAAGTGNLNFQAQLTGDGAIAQGDGATALGAGALLIQGGNSGSVTYAPVQVRHGHVIGGDFVTIVNQAAPAGDDPDEAKAVIAVYLQALSADLAGMKLGEIDASTDGTRQTPLQLADIYVPLATRLQIPEGMALGQWLARSTGPRRDVGEGSAEGSTDGSTEKRPVSALEALAQHRELTVLGEAGSGKSTFSASVLLALAQAWLGHGAALGALGDAWPHGAKLPVRVVLRRFAEQLPAGDQPARAGELWAFIGRDLEAGGHGLAADAMKVVRQIARSHGALIVLDGLDECGDALRRQRVLHAVHELIKTAGPACRFLLTARPYAWPGGADPAQGVYALAELRNEQIEQFIRAWYAALVARQWRQPGDAERKCADLIGAYRRADLLPLARNPLLLTLMATLHSNRGRLPDDRADLYDESVNLLLLRWNQPVGADKALLDELATPGLRLSDLREVLEELAFTLHEASVGVDGAADIGEDRLLRAFRPLLGNSRDKAERVVDYIEKRAGLLIGQGDKAGERQFSFPHRTFQEFLAACHLAARDDLPAECLRLALAHPGHWQVVLPLAARLAKLDRGCSAADELVGGQTVAECRARRPLAFVDFSCALIAGMQLQEIGVSAVATRERTRAIAARVAGWLVASLPGDTEEGAVPAVQRAIAGDVLAALGDPRFDAARLYLPADDALGFVPIAADPAFMIGTRKADRKRVAKAIGADVRDDEINDKPLPVAAFHIARYPVTVDQFRAFVDDTGHEPGDANALRDPGNRPVRYVSWHEALAYCHWLTRQLATAPALTGSKAARLVREQGFVVALPSEPEWECAARGGLRGAAFSWGDEPDPERANYDDTGINDTSSVGCFPANAFGVHNMIGNVWEWTRSLWGEYPYPVDATERENPNAGVSRVVRGGSWYYSRDFARCAFRLGDEPVFRDDDLGFRVVLRSPPVSKR